ncbi:unnamed protein product [Lupinus luteus]|uniref:Uncharacterized protein n=1 Tax=Lupinus luteus TaxID=3873 RepID=A0AAV1WP14_LUPLU
MEEDQEHIEEQMNHYLQSPIGYLEDVIIDQEDPFKLNIEKSHERIDLLIEEEPFCSAQLKNLSALKITSQRTNLVWINSTKIKKLNNYDVCHIIINCSTA